MRFWNYIVASVVLALIFEMAGISIAAELLSKVGISIETGLSIKTAAFYLGILTAAGVLASVGFGIAVGFITKSKPENFIILPFIIGAAFFITVWTGIVSYTFSNTPRWIFYLTLLIVAPLIVGFVATFPEMFRGTD